MGKEDETNLYAAIDDGADPSLGAHQGIGTTGQPPSAHAEASVSAESLDALLNGLLAAAHDGAWGFDDAAGHAQAQDISSFLQRAAEDWRLCALELRTQINHRGATPVEGGTPGGALQRGWQNLRAAMPGYGDATLLDACEHLQRDLLARLRDSLMTPLDDALYGPLRELERRATRRLGQLGAVRACIAAESAQQE